MKQTIFVSLCQTISYKYIFCKYEKLYYKVQKNSCVKTFDNHFNTDTCLILLYRH